MSALPAAYRWLLDLATPRIIGEALKLYGIREVEGDGNSPEILAWAKECGLQDTYRADLTPWCGLFAAVVVKRARYTPVRTPLWARAWGHFGTPSVTPGLGDVLVFQRPGGGHVGFYVGQDSAAFHVLGGNQGDAVSIVRIAKNRLLVARRPLWQVAQPASVQPYHLAATGGLSGNEA